MFQCSNIDNLYKRISDLKKEDIKKLIEWLQKQPHMPHIPEYYLTFYLQSCCFSVEQTKIALDNSVTIKTLCSEIFHFRGMEEIREAASVT